MASFPRRRLLDQIGSSPTYIDAICRFTGDIETDGPLILAGVVRGDGRVGGVLSMAAKSEWHGEVHAQRGSISGLIVGKLVVEEKLEIGRSAVIRGDVVARTIAIAKGAIVEGAVTVTSGQAVVSFEEKRKP